MDYDYVCLKEFLEENGDVMIIEGNKWKNTISMVKTIYKIMKDDIIDKGIRKGKLKIKVCLWKVNEITNLNKKSCSE